MPEKRTGQPADPDWRDPVDLLLVCSAGGHLLQLHLLGAAWREVPRAWVTLPRDDARSLLEGERVFYAFGPTTRNAVNLVRNLLLAFRLVRRLRPKLLVTTGAALAVPFAWVARLAGTKVVYVESLTRIDRPSLSMRLIRPVAHRTYVQWPELLAAVPGARYLGNVIEDA